MRAPTLPALVAALALGACLCALQATWPACAQAAADDELDAILGDFGAPTSPPPPSDPEATDPESGAEASEPEIEQLVALSGNVNLGAAYNVYGHHSSLGPTPGSGTDYGGLQRLRLRGNLQLDGKLPRDWKLRAEGYAFYDFAYVIHGLDRYTDAVREDYETEAEIQDLWIGGRLLGNLDLKLGRQVIDWGRSDTLRVNDVLNPLNNREPGLADIEDLRLPVTAARADLYLGSWSFTALIIPEIRFDYIPSPGSDFYPSLDFSGLPGVPGLTPEQLEALLALLAANSSALPYDTVDAWGESPEYGGAIQGIFSGWDIAFYAAHIYQNQNSPNADAPDFSRIALHDDRVTLVGSGGNYTFGSWLFKAELAFLDELDYLVAAPDASLLPAPPYRLEHLRRSRLDFMGGIEYYGFTDTNIALEVVNRHVFDYDPRLEYLPNYLEENSVEMALRVTRDLMNSRLHLNALGVVLGERAQRGTTVRLWVDYDLADALVVTGGYLFFIAGDVPPLSDWERNDRLFLTVKFSF